MFQKSNPETPGARGPGAPPPAPPSGAPNLEIPPAGVGAAPAPPPPAPTVGAAPAPPAPRPPEPARPTEHKPSVLGADLKIRGGIEGRGEIQLHGRAWGDVKVERLIVGDTAELEGSVQANVVEVRGKVVGSIEAPVVRLFPSARVEGDITYDELQIDSGARFEGRAIHGVPSDEASAKPAAAGPKGSVQNLKPVSAA